MFRRLIILLLIVGCSTEPEEDNIIDLPTEFPLSDNVGWVYEKKEYNNAQDFISGNNPTVSYDTLRIMGTSEGYYLWNYNYSDYVALCKNYDNKFMFIGHSIHGEIDMFEKPNVVADYSLNLDTSDTTNYTFKFDERSTTIDTLFGNSYYIYIFKTLGENDYVARQFYNIEGWTYGSSYNLDSDYYSKTRMIKKLDNIEININVE